jgi:hypothetical protein
MRKHLASIKLFCQWVSDKTAQVRSGVGKSTSGPQLTIQATQTRANLLPDNKGNAFTPLYSFLRFGAAIK